MGTARYPRLERKKTRVSHQAINPNNNFKKKTHKHRKKDSLYNFIVACRADSIRIII